jgi:hypothetical protein
MLPQKRDHESTMSSELPSNNFESAFQTVQTLVANFDANETHYLSPGYQEQEARQDFISSGSPWAGM